MRKLLGTHRNYRRHGLVTKLLKAAHHACVHRGRNSSYLSSSCGLAKTGDLWSALYVRIPNLVAFLRHITPVLEIRLAKSALARYTGSLAITCGHEAIYFSFKTGSLIKIESEHIAKPKQGDAAFPHQSFLQLLFGMRLQVELEKTYTGRRANARGRTLLNTLFPKQNTALWMIR